MDVLSSRILLRPTDPARTKPGSRLARIKSASIRNRHDAGHPAPDDRHEQRGPYETGGIKSQADA